MLAKTQSLIFWSVGVLVVALVILFLIGVFIAPARMAKQASNSPTQTRPTLSSQQREAMLKALQSTTTLSVAQQRQMVQKLNASTTTLTSDQEKALLQQLEK